MQVKATRSKNVVIKMKQTEYDELKKAAKEQNTTMSHIVRRSLCLYIHKGTKGINTSRPLVGCSGCTHYDEQQTRLICHECSRYYSGSVNHPDRYEG